nr:hypothetical protein [Bacillus pumilus]
MNHYYQGMREMYDEVNVKGKDAFLKGTTKIIDIYLKTTYS